MTAPVDRGPLRPRESSDVTGPVVSEARQDPAWQPFQTRGVGGIEVSLHAPCRLAVTLGEFPEGRFRAERIEDAGSWPADGPPPAGIAISVRGGLMQITQPPEETGKTLLRMELPSQLDLRVRADECDIELHGDPVAIPAQLEPLPPRTLSVRLPGGATGATTPPRGDDGPDSVSKEPTRDDRRGRTPDIGVFLRRGSLRASDIAANLNIEMEEGRSDLARIDGRVTIDGGSADLDLSAVSGQVEILRAGSIRGNSLRSSLKVGPVGRLEISGLAGALTAAMSDATTDLEDLRGAVSLTLADSVATLREISGAMVLHLENSDLRVEGYSSSLRVEAQGGDVSLEGGDAVVRIGGSPARIGISKHLGPVIIDTSAAPVRLKNIRGAVSIRTAGANIIADDIAGPVEMDAGDGQITLSSLSSQLRVAGDTVDATIQGRLDGLSNHLYMAGQTIRLAAPPATYDLKVRAAGKVDSDFEWKPLADADLEAIESATSIKLESSTPGPRGASTSGAPVPTPPPGTASGRRSIELPPPPRLVLRGGDARIGVVCGGDVEIKAR